MPEQPNKDKSFVAKLSQHIDAIAVDLELQPPPALSAKKANAQPDLATLLSSVEVRSTDQIPKPPICLTIQYNNQQSVFGTLSNFSLIIGKAKSRKTFAVGIALAAAVKQDIIMSRFVGSLPADRPTVLYFDTEQGRYHVQRAVKRICELSGLPEPTNLKTYALRSLPTATRLEMIQYALHNTPGLGLVVIDGIRDLVFDINSPEEATSIATSLLRWTDELQIHILTVLHQNKGDNSARGHLGTELVNKAETVISISRDNDNKEISIVAPEFCRDKDFEPFAFSIDEQGLPYLVDKMPTSNSDSGRNRKSTAASLKPDEVRNIILRAFTNDSQLQYSPLRTNIIEASEYYGVSLPKSRAEGLITRILNDGQLIKAKTASQRYNSYQINPEKLPSQSS